LTVLVLARDYRSKLHRVYLGWGIAVTLWNLGVYHLSQDIPPTRPSLGQGAAIGRHFHSGDLFHLCMVISQDEHGLGDAGLYLLHVGFAISLFFNKFIIGVRHLDGGLLVHSRPGLSPSFSGVFTRASRRLSGDLFTASRKSAADTAQAVAGFAGWRWWVCGFWHQRFDAHLGHDTYPFTHIKFYPAGQLAAVFYVVIIGYSVLQHRLLDIHVTLSRFAAQIRAAALHDAGGFPALLLAISNCARAVFPFSFGADMVVLLVSALVAAFFFPQFFGKGSDKLERQILGDRFEYHAGAKFDPDHALLSRSAVPDAGIGGLAGRHHEDAQLPDHPAG
jgi:hypothetical protein